MARTIEISAEEISNRASKIGRETMSGDLRDAVIDILKTRIPTSWQQLTENEQRDLAFVIEQITEGIVERAVAILSSDGRMVVSARVKAIQKVTDEIVVQIVAPKVEDTLIKLAASIGKTVTIVTADADVYIGERGVADITEDAPKLPIEDVGTEAEAEVAPTDDGAAGNAVSDSADAPKRTRATKKKIQAATADGKAAAERASAGSGEYLDLRYSPNEKVQAAYRDAYIEAGGPDSPAKETGTAEVEDRPARELTEAEEHAATPIPPEERANDGFPSPFDA